MLDAVSVFVLATAYLRVKERDAQPCAPSLGLLFLAARAGHGTMRTACAAGAFTPLLIPDEAADDGGNNCDENETDEDSADIPGNPFEHI